MEKDTHVRPLNAEDWEAFRSVRLEALKNHRDVFSATWEQEASLSPRQWRERLDDAGQHTVGAFADGRLVGIANVHTSRPEIDSTGQTAHMGALYVRETHSGRGIAKRLVRALMAWTAEQPQFEKAHISHRAGHEGSRRVLESAGFRYTDRGPVVWHDGVTADDVRYELTRTEMKSLLSASKVEKSPTALPAFPRTPKP